jgi:PAS domain-containing protein
MAQRPIELILLRHLAATVAQPMCLVDEQEVLLYCNEPAERLLGLRGDEVGELLLPQRLARLCPTDATGTLLDPAALSVRAVMREQRPAQQTFEIVDRAGLARRVVMTAFPIIRQGDRLLGAVAIFWGA